ncbi:alpha/beta hydrolase [Zavarzinella formosa]|uniref:alpha/beta hydrolase n=1 Tax=Zavarzinella formosa TaxID=360055 RepID=UPI0002E88758|nr:alpha/beta hydrolase [Zavarzinella formosa]
MRCLSFVFLLLMAGMVPAQETPKTPPKNPSGPKLPEGTSVNKDLAYGDHERQKLDLYVPQGDGPFPIALWVHGGGWEAGSKDSGNPLIGLLAKGYAVASTNYRLSQHAKFPAQIHDVKGAVKFLRSNAKKYHLDADRFGVAGASAGGHLVALLGTAGDVKELEGDVGPKGVSSKVSCVLDFFGPTDLEALTGGKPIAPLVKLLGGTTEEKKDLAKQANPITFVAKTNPPFLIVHGDKDPLVPVSQSELLNDALKKAGVDTTLMVIPGAGHGNGVFTPELVLKYVEFFEKHLKPKKS